MAPVPWPGANNDFFELHIRKKKSIDWIGRRNFGWRKENIQIKKDKKDKGKYSNQRKKILQLEKGQYYNLRKKNITIRRKYVFQ